MADIRANILGLLDDRRAQINALKRELELLRKVVEAARAIQFTTNYEPLIEAIAELDKLGE